MDITQKWKKTDIRLAADNLYLAVLAMYILKAFSGGVLFYIPWPANFDDILRIMICAAALLRLGYAKPYMRKNWFVFVLTGVLWGFSWISTGYIFLLEVPLLVIGASGISHKKLLKVGFWTGMFVLSMAVLGSLTGCISDRVYSDVVRFRHSFGIVYPTDFAAHATFLALAGWALYGGYGFLLSGTCTMALTVFIYYYCRAKCSTGVLILLAMAIVYYSISEKYNGCSRAFDNITKKIDRLLIVVLPVCALVMIVLTLLYNPESEFMLHINDLLNGRLRLGKNALDTYGIHFWGTAFDQIGFGGGPAWSWTFEYNFVDSSYVLILVRYGGMVLTSLCIWYVWSVQKALKNGHRKLALAMALVAVHSMIEHHLPEMEYNLFLLLPFADFSQSDNQNESKALHTSNACILRRVVGFMILAVFFPSIVEYGRTIVDLLELSSPQGHIYFIFITAIIAFLVFFLWRIALKVFIAFAKKESPSCKLLIGLVILFISFVAFFLKGESVIRQGREEYWDLVEADRPVLEALAESDIDPGKVYVDHIPEIYDREFHNISKMILAAEGLSHIENATLITAEREELHALIDAGYAYGQISPWHAVYTNSQEARKVLTNIGISLTDYYSRQETLSLEETAACNGLELSENGTLLLNGLGNSISRGSGITLYKGRLRVEYQLRLTGYYDTTVPVATAKVTSDWGARTWEQQDILISDFNENGECTYIMEFKLAYDSPNTEILLYLPDGVSLEVVEIRYGKVG